MPRRVQISPPPNNIKDKNHYSWDRWFLSVYERTGTGPLLIQGYPVADLPGAGDWGSISSTDPFSSIVFVPDETGGPVLAYSNGTNWLRVTDGAIVS